jgi:hypothetical protein
MAQLEEEFLDKEEKMHETDLTVWFRNSIRFGYPHAKSL